MSGSKDIKLSLCSRTLLRWMMRATASDLKKSQTREISSAYWVFPMPSKNVFTALFVQDLQLEAEWVLQLARKRFLPNDSVDKNMQWSWIFLYFIKEKMPLYNTMKIKCINHLTMIVNKAQCWLLLVRKCFLDTALSPTTKKSHFFSSDESEEEEDNRKKFKIKIKPLPADCVVVEPSVDELKASIGNIALSPSPLVSSPALLSLAFILGEQFWDP